MPVIVVGRHWTPPQQPGRNATWARAREQPGTGVRLAGRQDSSRAAQGGAAPICSCRALTAARLAIGHGQPREGALLGREPGCSRGCQCSAGARLASPRLGIRNSSPGRWTVAQAGWNIIVPGYRYLASISVSPYFAISIVLVDRFRLYRIPVRYRYGIARERTQELTISIRDKFILSKYK